MPLMIKNLKKSFGEKVIFDGFSYNFSENGIVALIGNSGCGKTTLLRLICGLDKGYEGLIDGEDASFVFQEYRLFPTMTALENIVKALYERPTKENEDEAKKLLMRFGFTEEDTRLYPKELSGGMKQRVSLCRALLAKKPILLLDEPFKELDPDLRATLSGILNEEKKERLVIFTAHGEEMANALSAIKIYV